LTPHKLQWRQKNGATTLTARQVHKVAKERKKNKKSKKKKSEGLGVDDGGNSDEGQLVETSCLAY
jgi:hypothetical protein